MRYIENITITLAVLLFDYNYNICDYFYEPASLEWWIFRTNIYAIIFFMGMCTGLFKQTYYSKTVIVIGLIYCFGDIVDRLFFNIRTFEINDLLIYASSALFIILRYARKNKTTTG